MDIRLEHTSINMTERDTITVVDGKGARVAVQRGKVWLTQEHDTRDVLLRTGESFTLDRDGTAIVEALADAEVNFDAPDAETTATVASAGSRRGRGHLTALAVLGHRRAVASTPNAAQGWQPARG